jgi:hypothetical protein
VWAKAVPDFLEGKALIVRAEEARRHLAEVAPTPPPRSAEPQQSAPEHRPEKQNGPNVNAKPRRFYGSIEIDPTRPVKAFDTIMSAVVEELQRTPNVSVTLTLEIAAEAPEGFDNEDVGVVRDNTRQLKFNPDATGFD